MIEAENSPPRDPERWATCVHLARTLLMVGEGDRDLVKQYLVNGGAEASG